MHQMVPTPGRPSAANAMEQGTVIGDDVFEEFFQYPSSVVHISDYETTLQDTHS